MKRNLITASSATTPLTFWRQFLLICVGACIVLIITAVNEFPAFPEGMYLSVTEWFFNPYFGGWLWTCIFVGVATFCSGIMVLFYPSLWTMPFAFRLKIAYSYFVLTWLALLAFFFRLRGETPTLFLWIASILLLVMGLSYLWLCHWSEKFEEIFP